MNRFPHLADTSFPDAGNVDVYRYKNTFDYKRWGENVKIKVMQVPWDGLHDVPNFETDEARDAWFDARAGETQTLTSAINVLPDNTVSLPFPFDVMCRYNYIMVEFPIMTSAGEPLAYENGKGARRFFFFVYAVEQRAASCTLCALERDDWTTFINSCESEYLMLERGHAPMAATSVNAYLSNPIANNALLLAPDVNYGEASNVSACADVVLNDGDMYACVATTSNPLGDWGSKAANDWLVPASASYSVQGTPTPYVFAVAADSLAAFLASVDASVPQFKRTVQAVFIVPAKLLTLGAQFTFAGTECRAVDAAGASLELLGITKDSFGYPERYRGIAKLYTSPYAQIEVTDGNGGVTTINVEDTTGSLEVWCALSLAYPLIGVDAHLLGYGGAQRRSIAFKNVGGRSMQAQGAWYKTLMHWDVPTYAVMQQGGTENDYATHFDREQTRTSYENAYDSSIASADTGKANADASADTGKANADASADTGVTNTANTGIAQTNNVALAVAANTTTVARSNSASTTITAIGNSTSQAAQAYDAGLQRGVQEADAQAVAATTLTNAIGNLAGSITSGVMSGNVAGAAAGVVGGVISGVTSGVNAAVMLNAASSKVELSISNSQSKVTSQNDANTRITNNSTNAQTDNAATANAATTQQNANNVSTANTNAKNSAATAKANAKRTQGTAKDNAANTQATTKANAARTQATSVENAGRARATSVASVKNQIAQANLSAPSMFGSFAGGSNAVTRPMVASANVLTQPRAAIAQAGDQMLRYGYALNQQWKVESFSLMPKFTYWKASEAWIVPGNGVPEGAREKLRKLLENGVTVWANPDEIGKVSIYDNI